jgi:hypothetical protein
VNGTLTRPSERACNSFVMHRADYCCFDCLGLGVGAAECGGSSWWFGAEWDDMCGGVPLGLVCWDWV